MGVTEKKSRLIKMMGQIDGAKHVRAGVRRMLAERCEKALGCLDSGDEAGAETHFRFVMMTLVESGAVRRFECEYAAAVQSAVLSGRIEFRPGTVTDIRISHDDWCPVRGGGGWMPCEFEVRVNGELVAA